MLQSKLLVNLETEARFGKEARGELDDAYLNSGDSGTIRKFYSDGGYGVKEFKEVLTIPHLVGCAGVKDPSVNSKEKKYDGIPVELLTIVWIWGAKQASLDVVQL